MTPGGTPAESMHSMSNWICIALSSLGLMTTVQPAANAGASLLQTIKMAEFHGVIRPATPTGFKVTLA
ncbi:hypothetical protein D3C81_2001380 [compost metagenome]